MEGVDELVEALEILSSKENAAPAEVFKDFNVFVRVNNQQIARSIHTILEKFRPATRIGRILKIRLVDRFGVRSEVVNLLQSTDSLDTKQALKCRWFFAGLESDKNLTNMDVVIQMLPNLSHSVRLKVINKYASNLRNTETGEALYCCLKSRYGVREAVLVLPACGQSFIRDELPNLTGVVLRPNLIVALQKKYPSLAAEYLTYLADPESPHNLKKAYYGLRYEYSTLFQRLSQTDLPTFISMYDKYGSHIPYMTLGRRTRKSFIRSHFNDLLSKYDKCKEYLGVRFYKQLNCVEMQALYTSCILPPTLTEFFDLCRSDDAMDVLKHVKPEARSTVLQRGLQSKYGKDIFSKDYLPKLRYHWLECLPVDCRVEKVENKLTAVDNPREQAEFLAYLPVDQSIPRLKKLIESQSDVEVRSSIACQMVKTLKHNHHPKGFQDLFTYFNKRFRNEAKQFRERLLIELESSDKLLLQLSKDEWAPLDEFFDIIKLNREIPDVRWPLTSVMQTQIHCYFLRNIDVEAHLERYLEFQAMGRGYFGETCMSICRNTPYQRVCVEWFLKKIPSMQWKDNSDKLIAIKSILELVAQVETKREPNPIVIPEEIIVEMESLMKDTELFTYRDFKSMISRVRHFPSLRDRLWKIEFPAYVNEDILSRFLKKDPLLMRDKLEHVLAITFDRKFHNYRLFYAKCRLYESYGIPQKLAKICLTSLKLEEDESLDKRILETSAQPHAVRVLSLVLPPDEYAEMISKYTPTRGKIEDYSAEAMEMFALQKAICQSFVGISNPSAVLPQLKKLAVGDYLKIAVGSLSSVCGRVPEKDVLPLLEAWTDCPISLRKHVLRLIYRLAPTDRSMQTFVELFKKEKNSSLRRVILLEIRRTFIADPSDQTYNTMSAIINLLTAEDEVLKDITNVDCMNTAYVSRYLELIWNRMEDWELSLPNGKSKLIECIDKRIVKNLDSAFSTELLSHDLLNLPNPLSKFVYLCLLHAPSWDVQLARLGHIVSALTQAIQNGWNDRQTEPGYVFKVRRTVFEFVEKLCEASLDCDNTKSAARILTETKTALGTLKVDSLKHSYWLDAHVLYLDNKDNFEPALAVLYKNYVHQHQTLLPHSLVAALSHVVPMVTSGTKLAYELVKTELPLCQILATKIAGTYIKTDKELRFFNEMIDILMSSEHPEVQSAAAAYFEQLESSAIV